eukprot:TRINITY_DN1896_c0_g1_i1.p1 TRINITY_DN1896_c0_g1~~TRINITY_DN1896_c0_g1_i1.p1  ORF type:complete len:285 (+),score=48.38 TRINITY_DN1896_c0_g1_i1:32-856(+)
MEDAPLIVGHVQKTQEESITSTTNTWSVSSTSSWSASAREWLMRGGEGANRLTVRDTACELVGTCLIVLIGCTSVTAESGMGDTQIVMAFAGVVVAMVFCFDTLSGAHFNPAVTFTFLLLRQIGLVKACLYAAAQCTGAVLGAALVYWLVPNSMANHLGATVSVVSDWQCFVIEAIATSVLIGYVLMMAMHRSKPQPKRDLLPCGLWFLIVALVPWSLHLPLLRREYQLGKGKWSQLLIATHAIILTAVTEFLLRQTDRLFNEPSTVIWPCGSG